jgi:hypothetical protein
LIKANPEEYLKKRGRPQDDPNSVQTLQMLQNLMKQAVAHRKSQKPMSKGQTKPSNDQSEAPNSVDPVLLTLLGIPPDSLQQLPGFQS